MDQVTLTSKQTELPSLRMLAMESHLSRQGGTIEKVQLTIQKAIHALGMERPPNVLEALEKKDEMSSNAEYLRFTNEGYNHAKESISELQSYGLTIKSISELMQQIELFQFSLIKNV